MIRDTVRIWEEPVVWIVSHVLQGDSSSEVSQETWRRKSLARLEMSSVRGVDSLPVDP